MSEKISKIAENIKSFHAFLLYIIKRVELFFLKFLLPILLKK